ncbi:MAG: glycosyltransferase family 2 protein [Algicola sp.]|nr:glycosyltransferase family 2 protein [Algicola sp.]
MNEQQTLMSNQFGSDSVIDTHPVADNPMVSIIIPTYNCLEFLPTALKSIQRQQITELEILVIDDGSTDETWQYLALASSCDQRIRPLRLAGVGVAKARNQGLRMAKSPYIALLDADDYWFEGKLGKQLAFHYKQPTATLSFCNYLFFNQNDDDLGDCFSYWPRFTNMVDRLCSPDNTDYVLMNSQGAGTIFAENMVGTSGVMFNPQALGQKLFFDETLKSAEDWDFWLKAALIGPIGFTASVDMAYLMRPGSESSRVHQRLQYMQVIMMRYYKAVMRRSPMAIPFSVSRLLTGYAEYYRAQRQQDWYLWFHPVFCHSVAFVLSPSRRLFKALLADVKNLTPAVNWVQGLLSRIRKRFTAQQSSAK